MRVWNKLGDRLIPAKHCITNTIQNECDHHCPQLWLSVQEAPSVPQHRAAKIPLHWQECRAHCCWLLWSQLEDINQLPPWFIWQSVFFQSSLEVQFRRSELSDLPRVLPTHLPFCAGRLYTTTSPPGLLSLLTTIPALTSNLTVPRFTFQSCC